MSIIILNIKGLYMSYNAEIFRVDKNVKHELYAIYKYCTLDIKKIVSTHMHTLTYTKTIVRKVRLAGIVPHTYNCST